MITENIKSVRDNIEKICSKANRNMNDITVIAVSKTRGIEEINKAINEGMTVLGENKVQEIMDKYDVIDKDVKWHMIGHLQTNKVKYIADKVDLIHSVDSYKLLKEIDKRARQKDRKIKVLVQVNVANDDAKFGINASTIEEFLKEASLLENIEVEGLMTIVPFEVEKEKLRPYFKKMKDIFEEMKNLEFDNISMKHLSMGMTNDYDIAIEEGSNMVRIGTGIFGERIYK